MTLMQRLLKKSSDKPEGKVKLPDPINIGVRLDLFDWKCEATKASVVGEYEDQKVYIVVTYCGTRKKDTITVSRTNG